MSDNKQAAQAAQSLVVFDGVHPLLFGASIAERVRLGVPHVSLIVEWTVRQAG
ncbi:MAG: hypothetical protein ABJZ55_05320 [Fuerstiella sp.]